ncbi:MAG: carboxypeptidase-like regulatory domain-containing protein, partial [Rhodothermaceae bacterium]
MKSIKSLLVLIILLSSITILANEKGTITGRVFDKETNEIVELANVFIVNQSNPQSVIGDVTNSEGKFEIKNIPFGNYDFHIQMVGYKKYLTKNIKIGKEN